MARGAVPAANRVCGHVRTLGILWIAASVLHMMPILALHWIRPLFGNDWPFWGGPHVLGFVGFFGTLWALSGILGIIAGWGLLERQPWARMFAIVLGCISLVRIPFGTALGIYTLWVLLPAPCEEEYRRIARA